MSLSPKPAAFNSQYLTLSYNIYHCRPAISYDISAENLFYGPVIDLPPYLLFILTGNHDTLCRVLLISEIYIIGRWNHSSEIARPYAPGRACLKYRVP